ncbi:hypothetical protein MNAN1_000718 [Malassezia nana]|uniref:Ribosome assembly protein 3 n=1 Tax=Malassezia nana TaxID=180528 RepID=A0AAF0EG16_9BASI|nr:hypothetical protein MNAN1_000718 [Malassezia nana]
MTSAELARHPRRKRARKVRTAVVSSSDSSSEDEKPSSSPSESSSESSDSDADTRLSFDQEPDNEPDLDLDDASTQDDALHPPTITLPTQSQDFSHASDGARTVVGGPLATLTADEISQTLQDTQREAFRTLFMQALTDEFESELDALRQNDPFLADDTNTSAATGRMALLIDALSFGSEAMADQHAQSGKEPKVVS